MTHRGPIRQFTECCLACGNNVWDTDECVPRRPSRKEFAELPVDGGVDHPSYLEMRLRMKLTGTASPSQTGWVAALRRLLNHLDKHPCPGTPRTDDWDDGGW